MSWDPYYFNWWGLAISMKLEHLWENAPPPTPPPRKYWSIYRMLPLPHPCWKSIEFVYETHKEKRKICRTPLPYCMQISERRPVWFPREGLQQFTVLSSPDRHHTTNILHVDSFRFWFQLRFWAHCKQTRCNFCGFWISGMRTWITIERPMSPHEAPLYYCK